jgi:hypothetical protein
VTSCTLPADLLVMSGGEYSWSNLDYSPLITRWSAGREQLLTLLLLSTQHPWVSLQSTAGHTSVTLHSSLIGSACRAQLVTLLLLSTHHPWISWQSTAGPTSVTLHSSPMYQLADNSWSHFYHSPLITRGSADRAQMVILLLLSNDHPCVSWQVTSCTLPADLLVMSGE